MEVLKRSFFHQSPLIVAKMLLGKILVREIDGLKLSGRIVEVEAYEAYTDEAAHSYRGKTKRNMSLYKDAGHAYIHRIHMQNCIDIVTEPIDVPSSVLIRAIEPIEGIEIMKNNRKKEKIHELT
ncbi:MAG: DNA-3-methyladenine glycosylase, partial [Ignavibacteriae bacterium]|nr:DNA-3-methyladenine glycosylase [Ignavibacteriota bacterium]